MSLLMKALKQAEQRHQQATAEALEKSAAESVTEIDTGIDTGIDSGMDAEAGIGAAGRMRAAGGAAEPSAARPRTRARRSSGTALALEEARDALDDTVADSNATAPGLPAERTRAAATPGTPVRTAPDHSNPGSPERARPGSARSPAYAELSLTNDQPPTLSAADDAAPAQATVSRQVPRRAGERSPDTAGDHSSTTTAASPAPSRDPATFSAAHDGPAPRAADSPFGGAYGMAPDGAQIAPAQRLQPRGRRRSSPRNRRIALWTGVGTAVVVTGAWFGWQLLAPTPPLAPVGMSSLQAPPLTAAPVQSEAPPPSASPAEPSQPDPSAAAMTAATMAAGAATAASDPTPRPSGTAPLAAATTRSGVLTLPASEPRPAPMNAAPRRQADASNRAAVPVRSAEPPARPAEPPARSAAPSPARPTEPPARGVEPTLRAAEPAARAPAPPARAESAPAGRPGTVRLVRSDEGERLARMLESAYTALQGRDIEAARAIYEQVLSIDPNNTDALAGLATYSARAGNPLQAERLFNQVLAIDPNDQAARAGLVALRTSGDPAGQESQLRHLIAQDDSQPALHYALGNVLAAQGRWAEAQQSYFTASTGDAEQPDYAYNLAVSLERLKQSRAAAMHYRRALELAASRPARFPIDRARARLAAIDSVARQGD